ncbi:MAG TPA: phosphoribosylanthranilate isomerase [Ignavibacteriaceae bacterium]|nr:phosphoribosylanthranilate isomerase [Ignavibacteriaceae bacterium]
MNKKPFIQVAGVIDLDEAKMLMDLGVEYLGFPLRLPVNKEDLSEEEAIQVIKQIKPQHKAVLITYLDKADEIIEFCNKLNVNHVQLHGAIEVDQLILLKQKRTDLIIIKSLVVRNNNLGELKNSLLTLSPFVDFFITDTFDPSTGASGATGKTHDWNISKKLINLSSKPVIIAGGLNHKNVKDAILHTHPAGVDVHTGIEDSNGRKDFTLTNLFIKETTEAFESMKEN